MKTSGSTKCCAVRHKHVNIKRELGMCDVLLLSEHKGKRN